MDDSTIRVLLIEDDPDDVEVIRSYLASTQGTRVELEHAGRLADGMDRLATGCIDVVLLDLNLPDSQGLDTLRRAYAHRPEIPLVVLTGVEMTDTPLRAVREGAADYLCKGQLDGPVLVRALRYAIERSRRRLAEHTLEDTLALYHSLVESLPLNVFCKNLRGEITFGNRRYCQTLGLGPSQFLGKTDADLFPPHLVQKYRHDDQRVIDTGEIVEDVEEHRRPDGETLYVHVLKAPLRDAKGAIVGVQGMFWDVSARHRAEEALRHSQEQLRLALEASQIGTWSWNIAEDAIEWDDRLHAIFGVPPGSFRGAFEDFLRYIHPEDVDRVKGSVERALRNEARYDVDYRVQWPDGSLHHLTSRAAVFRNQRGQARGMTGVCLDITERKEAEVQLRRAKEAAEEASRVKSAFLANMSHEIRTPLNAILGMTQLVLDTSLEQEQREFLCAAAESGEALLVMINDLLDFSKMETGRLVLEKAAFDVREAVGEAMKWLTVRARSHGLELSCQVDADVPRTIVGDVARLQQVIVNLVANAIKFTEEGRIAVRVRREPQSDAGGDVLLHFSVSDTGIGIPEDKRAAIFEAFQQADGSTTRRFGGMGLGLTICARLVRLMEGRLWVESEVGQGSTFHFTAPFGSLQDPADPPPTPIIRPGRALRVLLAEDSLVNQKLAVGLLRKAGHEVTVVATGREAILAVEQGQFDVLLLDVQMPEMDGLEAAAVIREREKSTGRHLPIIAMTAHALQADRQRCLEAGMDDYLSKPIRADRLRATIESVLARTANPEPAADRAAPCDQEIDWDEAIRSVKGDRGLLEIMIEAVLEECPRLMAEIERAAAQQDAEALRFAAHKFKGAVRYFGAAQAFHTAFRLEQMGRDHDLGGASEVVAVLRQQAARIVAALANSRDRPLKNPD